MKLSKISTSIAALGVAAAISSPAHAGYVVLDGWEMDIGAVQVKNIGRLNLVSGTSTIEQQLLGGIVTPGSTFKENGVIYSISYTKENVVGAGDTGAPTNLPFADSLTLSFSPVMGTVTGLNPGGGFHYAFTSGSFTLSMGATTLATGSVVGLGGNAASTNIIGGVNGDSTLLALLSALDPSFALKDNLGNNLAADLLAGNVLLEGVTNNNVTSGVGNAPAPTFGACSFNDRATCETFSVASAGDGYLVRAVPEPTSLALAGLGLLGAGALRRRRSLPV